MGRRIGALFLDWLIAYGLAALLMSLGLVSHRRCCPTAVLVVWLVLGVVSVRLFGFTPGQPALGLRVASVDHRMHVGIGRATRARCCWWRSSSRRCSPTPTAADCRTR